MKWYTDADIDSALKEALPDLTDNGICAAQHPLIDQGGAFKSALIKATDRVTEGNSTIIPINLLKEAKNGGVQGTHWVLLVIKPNEKNTVKPFILLIDPLGNGTENDIDVLINEGLSAKYGEKWERDLNPLLLLIQSLVAETQYKEASITVTHLVQQKDSSSSCGPLLVANAVAEIKGMQRRTYTPDELEALGKTQRPSPEASMLPAEVSATETIRQPQGAIPALAASAQSASASDSHTTSASTFFSPSTSRGSSSRITADRLRGSQISLDNRDESLALGAAASIAATAPMRPEEDTLPVVNPTELLGMIQSPQDMQVDHFFDTLLDTTFSGLRGYDKENTVWIVVTHILRDVPYLLRAVQKLGQLVAIIPKGLAFCREHPEVKHFFDYTQGQYGGLLRDEINRKLLEDFAGTEKFLLDVIPANKRAVIIDEGGYFAEFFKALPTASCSDARIKTCVKGIVEWTKNGELRYEKVFDLPEFKETNTIPFASIATSPLKKTVDGQEIGVALVRATEWVLTLDIRADFRGLRIGLLGCGVVGKAVAKALANKQFKEIRLYDVYSPMTQEAAQHLRGHAENVIIFDSKKDFLKECDVIISATGAHGLTEEDFLEHVKPGVIIACGTSRDDELAKDALKNFIESEAEGSKYVKPWVHKDNDKKRIYLILGGSAVNFLNNSVVSPAIFAVGAAALVSGLRCIQGQGLDRKSIHTLRREDISNIMKTYEEYFGPLQEETMRFNVEDSSSFHERRFVGREAVLEKLTRGLRSSSTGVYTQVIEGLGGVGKSTLAREYIYRMMNTPTYNYIAWIHASTPEQLRQDFLNLAKALGVAVPDQYDFGQVVQKIYEKLESYTRILIVFDDVPNDEALSRFPWQEKVINILPHTSYDRQRFCHTHCIITTRNQDFGASLEVIKLDGFNLEEAKAYIRRSLDSVVTAETDQVALAEALHCFPLALSQALAYIREEKVAIQGYLALYKDVSERLECLKEAVEADNPYRRERGEHASSVYATLQISMQKITPAAKNLLSICAYFASHGIPRKLIERAASQVGIELLELRRALKSLRAFSLLTSENSGPSLNMHALLQEVVRIEDRGAANFLLKAALAIFELYEKDFKEVQKKEPSNTIFHFIFHLHSVYRYFLDFIREFRLEEAWRTAYIKISMALGQAYNFLQAPREAIAVLSLVEEYVKQEKISRAFILYQLGCAYRQLGEDVREAMPRFREAIEIYNECGCREHENFFNARYLLALSLSSAGEYPRAEKDFMALHAEQGISEILRAQVEAGLAGIYLVLSQSGGSEELELGRQWLDSALERMRSIYGQEKNFIMVSPLNLSGLYEREYGELDKAISIFEECIEITRKFYGENAFCIATFLQNIGQTYLFYTNMEGREDEARAYFQRSIEIYLKWLNKDSESQALNCLLACYEEFCNHDEFTRGVRERLRKGNPVLLPVQNKQELAQLVTKSTTVFNQAASSTVDEGVAFPRPNAP